MILCATCGSRDSENAKGQGLRSRKIGVDPLLPVN